MYSSREQRLFDERYRLTDRFGKEELFFVNWNSFAEEPDFFIKEAGITLPDPDYRIVRTDKSPVYDYLYVLEYVEEGAGTIEVEGASYPIEKGDSYFLRKRLECVYYSSPDRPLKKVWVNCAGSVLDSLAAFSGLNGPVVIAKVNTARYFYSILDRLREIGNLGKYEAYRQSIHRIADILSSISYAAANLSTGYQSLPERIRKLIDDSPYYNISPEELSASEHYSLRHINRVFREEYGMTPKQYILERKIESAKTMIRSRRYSMREVSGLLGFCDEHHFMNTFKRLTGQSAGDWREKNGKL